MNNFSSIKNIPIWHVLCNKIVQSDFGILRPLFGLNKNPTYRLGFVPTVQELLKVSIIFRMSKGKGETFPNCGTKYIQDLFT